MLQVILVAIEVLVAMGYIFASVSSTDGGMQEHDVQANAPDPAQEKTTVA